MIIDKTNPQHQALFGLRAESMHNEVLLCIDASGGFHTATQEVCCAMKNATSEQRKQAGWDTHETVLESLDLTLVTPAKIEFPAN